MNSCVTVSTGELNWSEPLNLLHGSHTRYIGQWCLTAEYEVSDELCRAFHTYSGEKGFLYDLGVNVIDLPSPFQRTRLAMFVPRFILQNQFSANVYESLC